MHGYDRSNYQRPVTDHPSLGVLRSKGLGVLYNLDGSYTVAGTILYWPTTGLWRAKGGEPFGYGVEKLVAAVMPAVAQ
jgi:hypothetical protein